MILCAEQFEIDLGHENALKCFLLFVVNDKLNQFDNWSVICLNYPARLAMYLDPKARFAVQYLDIKATNRAGSDIGEFANYAK